MKIHKHITCMTLALAMLLGLSSFAGAQVMPDGMANSGWITGDPSLSPERQTAVRNIYNEYYQSTAVLRQQYYAKHSELNAQLYGGNTDDRRVQVLIKEISDVNARIFENQVNLRRRLIREGVSFGSYEYGGYGRHSGMGSGGGMGYGMHGGY